MGSPNNIVDHTTENANLVYDLVLVRLPFMADTAPNAKLCSILTYEIMQQLEPCFQVASMNGLVSPPVERVPHQPTYVGNETYYTFAMKSPVADILACYLIAIQAAQNIAGTSMSGPPSPKFLKQTKAGSVEVEWGQLDMKQMVGLVTDYATLYKQFKHNAATKMFGFGCILDIYDDVTLAVEIVRSGLFKPFITIGGGGCCD